MRIRFGDEWLGGLGVEVTEPKKTFAIQKDWRRLDSDGAMAMVPAVGLVNAL